MQTITSTQIALYHMITTGPFVFRKRLTNHRHSKPKRIPHAHVDCREEIIKIHADL